MERNILSHSTDHITSRDLRRTPKPDYVSDSNGVGIEVGVSD
jgi:hypothetical protein